MIVDRVALTQKNHRLAKELVSWLCCFVLFHCFNVRVGKGQIRDAHDNQLNIYLLE